MYSCRRLSENDSSVVVCGCKIVDYFYNLKNCKKPEYTLNGYKGHPVITMALQNTLKVRLINYW